MCLKNPRNSSWTRSKLAPCSVAVAVSHAEAQAPRQAPAAVEAAAAHLAAEAVEAAEAAEAHPAAEAAAAHQAVAQAHPQAHPAPQRVRGVVVVVVVAGPRAAPAHLVFKKGSRGGRTWRSESLSKTKCCVSEGSSEGKVSLVFCGNK